VILPSKGPPAETEGPGCNPIRDGGDEDRRDSTAARRRIEYLVSMQAANRDDEDVAPRLFLVDTTIDLVAALERFLDEVDGR
jgi:hypothetical protein